MFARIIHRYCQLIEALIAIALALTVIRTCAYSCICRDAIRIQLRFHSI